MKRICTYMLAILIVINSFGCATQPKERLYEGEPLPAEQVSIISNGLTESEPRIGGFFPVKIDDSNKCHLYRESACEILPGKHTLQTNYVWFTSEASAVSTVTLDLALCLITLITCFIPMAQPDLECQSILEFDSQGGHTYALKISEASDNSGKFNVVLEDTKSGQLIANEPCILIEKPQYKEPIDTL